MENSFLLLFSLLGFLGMIHRIREKRHKQIPKVNIDGARLPSFDLPDQKVNLKHDVVQQEALVWEELKKLHQRQSCQHSVFETEKFIHARFEISKEMEASYRYYLIENELFFQVCVLQEFPAEITTDLFILAAHFNNLLNFGKVIVEVNKRNVFFSVQNEICLYALFPEKIHLHLSRHYQISKDVFASFLKFINEGEEPAVIIGELLKKQESGE
ncbi:MAG: hypothetical protein ACKOXP_07005 [Flavobacteriales bacterium]